MNLVSLDTETTGLDIYHGCLPYFITITEFNSEDNKTSTTYWEANNVDIRTRQPTFDEADLIEVLDHLEKADRIIGHNIKFDYRMIKFLFRKYNLEKKFNSIWQWKKAHDTTILSHLVNSNKPHNLTDCVINYLGINIEDKEIQFKEQVRKAKKQLEKLGINVNYASSDNPLTPSSSDSATKEDGWVLKVLSDYLWENSLAYKGWKKLNALERKNTKKLIEASELPGFEIAPDYVFRTVNKHAQTSYKPHLYRIALVDYANTDSQATLELFKVLERRVIESGLEKLYKLRMDIVRIANEVEEAGITFSLENCNKLKKQYQYDSKESEKNCLRIAKKYRYPLEMPKSGRSNSLNNFFFNVLKIPVVKKSKKTGEASLDKASLDIYSSTLTNKDQLEFVNNLKTKRERDTAISYLENYLRFSVVIEGNNKFRILHPFLNPTGTATIRWSSSNPNEQNISAKKESNLRYCFAPTPEYEWYSLDYANIELRIPAYLANEKKMIALFEKPNNPPYYGSNHLLCSHILHKEKFESCKNEKGIVCGHVFKDKFKELYKKVKNGNFAVQYGALPKSGTADKAYGIAGGQKIIENNFTNIKKLNQTIVNQARINGFIETMVDKSLGIDRGYPLFIPRNQYGSIRPTTPLNYKVQGTACYIMMKAMIYTDKKLSEWRKLEKYNGKIIIQVHDELVFQMPKTIVKPTDEIHLYNDPNTKKEQFKSNLWRIRELRNLMKKAGDDVGIPTEINVEYFPDNWSKGITIS